MLEKTYQPAAMEARRYALWERSGAFAADPDSDKPPYAIMMPPPNVTGSLHMGHALTFTLQDVLVRYQVTLCAASKAHAVDTVARSALPQLFRSRWDREFESVFLQRGVCKLSVPTSRCATAHRSSDRAPAARTAKRDAPLFTSEEVTGFWLRPPIPPGSHPQRA
jgi:hypothetical protein